MQIKTILNRVQKFKSFVYKSVSWVESQESPVLEVTVVERSNGKLLCSMCGCPRPGYNRQQQRRFEFVPLRGIKVFLAYAPRRVDRPTCGVRVEQMPWALDRRSLTKSYGRFLAN
jgi:transposase